MIDHELGDDADATGMGRTHELPEVGKRAMVWMNVAIGANVITVILSLPKIRSANNDCVVRRGLGWRGGFHIVVSVVAAAHPYPIQDACASHCNTPNTRSGSAADAVRQRSERDPNSRAVASRSDVQRTGSATATSGRSGGHESPSFSLDS